VRIGRCAFVSRAGRRTRRVRAAEKIERSGGFRIPDRSEDAARLPAANDPTERQANWNPEDDPEGGPLEPS